MGSSGLRAAAVALRRQVGFFFANMEPVTREPQERRLHFSI